MTEAARYAQLILPVFWLGMVAAISFLEAPIKFRAPGVSLAIGLGIGRKVFTALNAVELVLTLVLAASCIVAKPDTPALTFFVLAAMVLIVQVAAIRPLLGKRSDRNPRRRRPTAFEDTSGVHRFRVGEGCVVDQRDHFPVRVVVRMSSLIPGPFR